MPIYKFNWQRIRMHLNRRRYARLRRLPFPMAFNELYRHFVSRRL